MKYSSIVGHQLHITMYSIKKEQAIYRRPKCEIFHTHTGPSAVQKLISLFFMVVVYYKKINTRCGVYRLCMSTLLVCVLYVVLKGKANFHYGIRNEAGATLPFQIQSDYCHYYHPCRINVWGKRNLALLFDDSTLLFLHTSWPYFLDL